MDREKKIQTRMLHAHSYMQVLREVADRLLHQYLKPANADRPFCATFTSLKASFLSLGLTSSMTPLIHANTARNFVCFLPRTLLKAVKASLHYRQSLTCTYETRSLTTALGAY